MSTASNRSRQAYSRVNSLQNHDGRISRSASRVPPRLVAEDDAYSYALGVAYLHYLLQPRPRRLQHVAAAASPVAAAPGPRSMSSINDMVKDLTAVRDSKSTRLPHGFMAELEKRLSGIITGNERRPEYQDATVKRTFAVYYIAFTEHNYRRQMEKDRRVEDLVLIFFSNATKELQKGKSPADDAWKSMVDRHLALFVRLLSTVLKEHDWGRDRPELTSRLATLESKLLKHDQDLAAVSQRAGGAGGATVEVEVPRSYEVKDMPLALVVAAIFGRSYNQIQADVNRNRPVWTERAALTDLKTFQNLINLDSSRTLRPDDFDLDDAYEAWRKQEGTELSQMMLAILRAQPDLAKSGRVVAVRPAPATDASTSPLDAVPAPPWKTTFDSSGRPSPFAAEPPDLDRLRLQDDGGDHHRTDDGSKAFTFIPPDPRAYYRAVLLHAFVHDQRDTTSSSSSSSVDAVEDHHLPPPPRLLSMDSNKLLLELATRWRLPPSSRLVLFLDVITAKYLDQDIGLDTLDAAFEHLNEPQPTDKRSSVASLSALAPFADRSQWTISDFAQTRRNLSALHDALLRDLYETLLHCYEPKPPSIGPIMYVLENHVRSDPAFSIGSDEDRRFSGQLADGLRQKALEVYSAHLHSDVPHEQDEWQFYHVIQFGKTILKLAERIQKRYKKNPEIMG